MSLTYSAPAVALTLKIIESSGVNPDPLMRKLRIDPQKIDDPNARFPYKRIDTLWAEAAALIDDSCFGLKAATYWHPSLQLHIPTTANADRFSHGHTGCHERDYFRRTFVATARYNG